MKVLDIFEEFMTLNYTEPGEWNDKFKDVPLKKYIIARYNKDKCTIHYLINGLSIGIDWKWLDLFSSLNVVFGNRILNISESEIENDIERFIYLFLNFQVQLDRRNGDTLLTFLSEICKLKTNCFREYLESKYSQKLEPIIFKSIEKIVEI